jgi:hypothetical protein
MLVSPYQSPLRFEAILDLRRKQLLLDLPDMKNHGGSVGLTQMSQCILYKVVLMFFVHAGAFAQLSFAPHCLQP